MTKENLELSQKFEVTELKITELINEWIELLEKLKLERNKVNEYENGNKGWEIVK